MKKLLLAAGVLLSVTQNVCALNDYKADSIQERTVMERLTGWSRKTDAIQVNLNTHLSFNTSYQGSQFKQAAFRLDYLRLEIEGNITNRIYYQWLQHLNKSNVPENLDNMPGSIDCAGIGFHITPTVSTFFGKQYADYGGYEYDASPAEIYEYSDMGQYMTCYLVGAHVAWWLTPKQEIRFQIVNSRSGSLEDTYGILPQKIKETKVPLGYTLNWNGSFLDESLNTRWSASLFHEAQNRNIYFYALGTEYTTGKFNMYFDAMYSSEGLDKLGMMSDILYTDSIAVRAQHVSYVSLVAKLNYRIYPKVNLFIKGMYETTSVLKNAPLTKKGKYRTAYGYLGGIEYYPMEDNLHFFLTYIGRSYRYTERARTFGACNDDPQRISLGLIYKIPVF